MAVDVDKWIEIAKQCKYLPETDLKVRYQGVYSHTTVNEII